MSLSRIYQPHAVSLEKILSLVFIAAHIMNRVLKSPKTFACIKSTSTVGGRVPPPPREARRNDNVVSNGFHELLNGWLRGRGPRHRVWSSLNLNLWTDKSSQRPASFQPLIIHGVERERESASGLFKSVLLLLSLPRALPSLPSSVFFFCASSLHCCFEIILHNL